MTDQDQPDLFRYNPELYRRMSEPFASTKEADEASRAFLSEVHALRIRYRIADVTVGISMPAMVDGKVQRLMGGLAIGNSMIQDAICMHLAIPAMKSCMQILMLPTPEKTAESEPK